MDKPQHLFHSTGTEAVILIKYCIEAIDDGERLTRFNR